MQWLSVSVERRDELLGRFGFYPALGGDDRVFPAVGQAQLVVHLRRQNDSGIVFRLACFRAVADAVLESYGRLALARHFGAEFCINPAKENAREKACDMTGGHFFDTVMEITGSIKGLQTACSIVKFAHVNGMQNTSYHGRGRILSSSVYGGEEIFPFGLAHDLMLKTPDVFNVHPSSAADVLANDIRGVEMFAQGSLPLHEMITHTCAFSQLPTGFGWLESPPEGYNKGLVLFD